MTREEEMEARMKELKEKCREAIKIWMEPEEQEKKVESRPNLRLIKGGKE